MTSKTGLSQRRFFPLLLKGYFIGTVVSAVLLNMAVAIISPGDGGTWLVLAGGGIFPLLMIGLFAGAASLAIWNQAGLEDSWSGALVGFTYGVVWFFTVKNSGPRAEKTIA
jgi:hypothetical protein